MRRFLGRLGLFLAPFVLPVLALEVLLARLGETLPMSVVARLQNRSQPELFLARYSDHTFALKRDAVRLRRPRILALGGSRGNQWRSAMFRPDSFYNAGNAVFGFRDYLSFLEGLDEREKPEVLLFPLDFYMFNPKWQAYFGHASHGDVGAPWSPERALILESVWREWKENPGLPFIRAREPLHGVPALGLQAIRAGTGNRNDGSYQYGAIIRGAANSGAETLEGALRRIPAGSAPFDFAEHLDPAAWRDLGALAAYCARRGIAMVGLSMPYEPPIPERLDAQPELGIWREFRSPETSERLRRLGILYIDFTRLDSFGGRPEEFVDPFHASEPAYIRMLLTMLRDDRVRSLFPRVDTGDLARRLATATWWEVYRNEF